MNQSENQLKWNQILSEWEASGQSQVAFCKEHNVSISGFNYNRSKQLQNRKKSVRPNRESQFIEAKPEISRKNPGLLSLEIESNGSIRLQLNLPGWF